MTESAAAMPVVRAATSADLPELMLVVNHFVRENRLLPRTVDELEELLPTGFVGIIENRIVGFAALEVYSPKLAEVRSLAVQETVQGQGIGKMLVEECVRLAQSRGILEVMAVTSADDFFLSCGFDFTLPGEKKALFIQTRESVE